MRRVQIVVGGVAIQNHMEVVLHMVPCGNPRSERVLTKGASRVCLEDHIEHVLDMVRKSYGHGYSREILGRCRTNEAGH